jgi:hypothetical protein
LASVDVREFQTREAHFNLNVTKIKYIANKQPRKEREKVAA